MEIRVKFDAALWFICVLCAVIAASALLMAYPALWPWLGSNSSNIASWVQAIGSIAAIFGAFGIAQRQAIQHKEGEELKELEMRRRRIHTFIVLLRHAEAICKKIASETPLHAQHFQWAALRLIEVGGINARFNQLDPSQFAESSELMDAISVATASAQALTAEVDGYVRGMQFGHHVPDSLLYMASQVAQNMARCAANVEKMMAARNFPLA